MNVVRAVVALGAVVAALIVGSPVSASPPTTGTGSGVLEIRSITNVNEAGGNVIQERELRGTVTGALSGTFVEQVRGVIHPSGLVTFQGTIDFTGEVEGCGSGTLTLGLSGRGVVGAPVTEAKVHVIKQAQNSLSVHGVGTVSQVGLSLTYEVRFQC